jgi:chloramphenicol-sensitive protein RarD
MAAAVLAVWTWRGGTALAAADPATIGWLLLAGPLTAVPLLLFAIGARRIPLATLGLLQYIGPTLQFGLGIWVFREPFDRARLAGFTLIWTACALYSAEGWWRMRQAGVRV